MNFTTRGFVLALTFITLLACASSASADTIVNISGPGPNGSFSASFTLPATPSAGGPLGFDFANLPVDLNGKWTDLTVVFDSSVLGGGVLGLDGFYLFGQQLFSWSSSSSTPTIDFGTFQLYGATGSGVGTYSVTITDPPSPPKAVPEPSSILLLGMGALMLFGVHLLRRFA
jgi:PEP-CTERM motif